MAAVVVAAVVPLHPANHPPPAAVVPPNVAPRHASNRSVAAVPVARIKTQSSRNMTQSCNWFASYIYSSLSSPSRVSLSPRVVVFFAP